LPFSTDPDDQTATDRFSALEDVKPQLVEVRRELIDIGGTRALRRITDLPEGDHVVRGASYLISAGAETASVAFLGRREGFDARLPELDAIARTVSRSGRLRRR
jgi:hypothetical protein